MHLESPPPLWAKFEAATGPKLTIITVEMQMCSIGSHIATFGIGSVTIVPWSTNKSWHLTDAYENNNLTVCNLDSVESCILDILYLHLIHSLPYCCCNNSMTIKWSRLLGIFPSHKYQRKAVHIASSKPTTTKVWAQLWAQWCEGIFASDIAR